MMNRSAPAAALIPTLMYDDLAAAIAWLDGAFGFRVRLQVKSPDGYVGHAQLELGDAAIMLGESRSGLGPPRGGNVGIKLCVRVGDVDAHCSRARQFGTRIELEPTTYPYGERQYTAIDSSGYHWTFTQTIADIAPEEWGAVTG